MKITYLFVGIIVGFIAGYFITHNSGSTRYKTYCHTDTLLVHDTVTVITPRYVSEKKVGSRQFKVKPDSACDTVTACMDMVSRRYSDELYDAYISGIEPNLDSIHIYIPRSIVTRTVPAVSKRWHFGVSAGAAATPRGLQPYIGIGVTYSLFAF
ncbi:MAG: hypothetical protein K2M52_03630 [Paramuribaculum sp.]|nr:hypothetical protein [Paramuribaculum sp.]MDE7452404.1 hypothetical protein [Paramuribaculum sp.]